MAGGAATAAAISFYCTSTWCNHSAKLNADWLPDETPTPLASRG
jgi:hypothetical protein